MPEAAVLKKTNRKNNTQVSHIRIPCFQSTIFTRALLAALSLVVGSGALSAEPPVADLPDLTVAAENESGLMDANISDSRLLRLTPGLAFDAQGGGEGQADLSIRGSSFSGAGLAVNGLNLGNPQTEHFNAELPLPLDLFGLPEIITGLSQMRGSDGNLVGTIALNFRPAESGGRLGALFGERARNRQTATYHAKLSESADGAGALYGGAFAVREKAKGLDYGDNDLDLEGGGGHLQYRSGRMQTDLAIAHRGKEFGARGYYGVSPDYFARERIEDSLVLLSSRIEYDSDSDLRFNILWREIDDDYRLWLPGTLYRNRHNSNIWKADMAGANPIFDNIHLDWRLDAGIEDIDSRSLGDHSRRTAGMALLPRIDIGGLQITIGNRLEVFRDDAPAWLPQFGIEYGLSGISWVYAGYTETVRQPSYTELNYESPGSLGNAGLERQDARNYEVGIKAETSSGVSGSLAVFMRDSENTVDWIQPTEESRWLATDIGGVDAFGVEAAAGYNPRAGRIFAETYYLYLDKSNSFDHYASRYALDYARHLVQCRLGWRATRTIRLVVGQDLRWQTENNARGGDDFGVLGRVETMWNPVKFSNLQFGLGVDNIWNDHFQQFPGQRSSDQAFFTSMRIRF